MKRLVLLLSVILLIPGLILAGPGDVKVIDRPSGVPSFLGWAPGELIVQFRVPSAQIESARQSGGQISLGVSSLDEVAARYGVTEMRQLFRGAQPQFVKGQYFDLSRFYVVHFDQKADLDEVMKAYLDDPNVESVEKNGIHAMYATPNDGYYSYQWHLNQASDHDVDAPEAWNIETGNTAIILAILDSGTRYYHPDLGGVNASPTNPGASRGNMWINTTELNGTSGVDDDGNGYVDDWIGWDFINGVSNCWSGEDCTTADNDPRDFNGHGTHTAGIIGMLTNDGYGMAGIAGGWGSGSQAVTGNGIKIMPLRMGYSYNYLGQEYGVVMMDAAASAFYYAANNGARIASCSWGSSNSGGIGAAADYFIASGGVIFVAAGNDGSQTADYLNGRGDCVSVAATDENDNGASFTTYGTWVDICAPGNNIYATYHDHTDPNTNYWAALSGTSMATPLTAGVAGLIWSQNPTWTASQVKTQLFSTADNIDAYLSSQYIGKMGSGRVNAYAAVNTGPPPAPVANFSGSPTTGTAPLTVNFTDLSTGSITSWSWTFGDGGTSSAQNPSHQYTSAGTYSVTLTVTGPGGSDGETKTDYITVNPCVAPVANFSGSPTSGTAPLTVNFTDLSTNSPTGWSWTFGDGGTSSAQNPAHTYTAAGTYTVSLTASNTCGSDGETRTAYITVTEPTVDYATLPYSTGFESGLDSYWFTQSNNSEGRILVTTANTPHSGSYHMTMDDNLNGGLYAQNEAWLRLNLAGKSQVELTFWWKEFGDETHTQDGVFFSNNGGSTFTKVRDLINGTTTYQQIVLDVDQLAANAGLTLTGTFVVKFQQYDNYSINTDGMAFDDISVVSMDVPPVANFSGTPTSGVAPLAVQFTDLSSNNPTSWSWTFGDGGTSSAQNPSYTYTTPGTYSVSLTASNAFGSDVETKSGYITVSEAGAWTVITYDTFESGMGNYTDGGSDMSRYTRGTYAWEGRCAADIQDNSGTASSFYHTTTRNVSGYLDMEVEFYFIAVSMEVGEDFWVQYYNGSAWQTVATFARGTHFNNGTFYNVVVPIPRSTYNYPTNARLRFVCDASNDADDVYIDNIEWRGMGSAGAMAKVEPELPERFSLAQNYPNPFNPTTTIEFSLPVSSDITLKVYNIMGQEVAELADGRFEAGHHSVEWDASRKASGVYFYRITTDAFTATKKMILLK
ncbi:MAG: PKD domain-containing protein [candidate division Zixibacteria bacterium]|nr:PKD domain-containing protein [candidate division Zixibacteria bacterium]